MPCFESTSRNRTPVHSALPTADGPQFKPLTGFTLVISERLFPPHITVAVTVCSGNFFRSSMVRRMLFFLPSISSSISYVFMSTVGTGR